LARNPAVRIPTKRHYEPSLKSRFSLFDKVSGAIEGVPGKFEYIEMEGHWEGKGVARAAFKRFYELSRRNGCETVQSTNPTVEAAEHLLKTEGFEEQLDGSWTKDLAD
jgi:hypothetical protein